MALNPIFAAYREGGTMPAVRGYAYADGQTFLQGAVLIFNSGNVVEGGSNPTGIVGVALQAVATNAGYQMANSPSPVTGIFQGVSVLLADDANVMGSQLVNNSATPIAPVAADVGATYGLKAYSGIWVVDKNLTSTDARVTIVRISISKGLVFWKVLAANRAA